MARCAATVSALLALAGPAAAASETAPAPRVRQAAAQGRYLADLHSTGVTPTPPLTVPSESTSPTPQPLTPQPTTVTQPPGVSGYVPIEYVLPILGVLLVAFLGTRPGTKEAIKALAKLISRSNTPPM